MYHTKQASVRDLRYRFALIERPLRQGERLEITKRKQVIARLLAVVPPAVQRPDFWTRLRRIYGGRMLQVSGA